MRNEPSETERISILMPIHNGETYLAENLESILQQSFPHWHLVAALDRCTDGTEEILRSLIPAEQLVIVKPARTGISAALNAGLEHCGELVARMDADDLMDRDRLQHQRDYMHSHHDVALVGSACRAIDWDGSPLGSMHWPVGPEQLARRLIVRNSVAHPSVMFRKSVVQSVGGYRSEMDRVEDYDLWLRMAQQHRLDNMAAPLLTSRRHPLQSTKVTPIAREQLNELAIQRRLLADVLGISRWWPTAISGAHASKAAVKRLLRPRVSRRS